MIHFLASWCSTRLIPYFFRFHGLKSVTSPFLNCLMERRQPLFLVSRVLQQCLDRFERAACDEEYFGAKMSFGHFMILYYVVFFKSDFFTEKLFGWEWLSTVHIKSLIDSNNAVDKLQIWSTLFMVSVINSTSFEWHYIIVVSHSTAISIWNPCVIHEGLNSISLEIGAANSIIWQRPWFLNTLKIPCYVEFSLLLKKIQM